MRTEQGFPPPPLGSPEEVAGYAGASHGKAQDAPGSIPAPPPPDPPTPAPSYPWRGVLASWPDPWRERWGRVANRLAEGEGVPFPEDERRAFDAVAAEYEAEREGKGGNGRAALSPPRGVERAGMLLEV